MATIEQTKKRLLRVLTKKDKLTANEVAAKLDKDFPGHGYEDPRVFGRSIGGLVREGKVVKHPPKSRPHYSKA